MGHHIIHYTETDSTNREAWRLIEKASVAHGTIIVADFQHNGKGQAGNSWESQAGKNLLMTLILQPGNFPANNQFAINMAVSVALSETVTALGKNASCLVKWPNDLYVGQNKIGGILIENSIIGDTIAYCIVGIGLNINQMKFASDAPNPISLARITGKEVSVALVLEKVCLALEKWYTWVVGHDYEYIRQAYHANLLGYNKLMSFSDQDGLFNGRILGVDNYGYITIDRQGMERQYGFKEVAFRW